ncbi:hypothetical protein AB7M43_003623 [Bradyrhizobium elkanii]
MTARHLQRQCADRSGFACTLVAEICVSAARRRLASDIGCEVALTLRLSGVPLKDPRSRGQELAEECDNNVLMGYGRCLRPALYSSLRSSPSHPTGVSALRVTIAIANARFARKQWGLRKSTAKSRRLFRNEWVANQRVRAGAIEGSTAMTRTSRKSPRVPTGRWRDKRPQCAARSVGCCCFPFLPTRQCVASTRDVCLTINSLPGFCFSHIAEAADG